MNVQRNLPLLTTLFVTLAAVAGSASGQPAPPAVGQADTLEQASRPSRISPASGPTPISPALNRRHRASIIQRCGDS
jgi:hypothetical protein